MPNSSDGQQDNDGKSDANAPMPALARLYLGHLDALENLCNDLEEIADGLPGSASAETSQLIAANIIPIIKSAHKFEEDHVYPVLSDAVRNGTSMRDDLVRLKSEHWVDEDMGEEIALTLHEFATDKRPGKAETLSWMLRGFFESVRRHIAFEHAVVVPLIRKKLGPKNVRS
jgi:hypothetical protein